MIEMLVSTSPDWVLTIARLTIGIILFTHGAQKVLGRPKEAGMLQGPGFSGTLRVLTSELRIPASLAVLVISSEFFGGLGLIVGLLTRIAALDIILTMLGAIAMVHSRYGLFMNMYGNKEGHGFEYHVLTIALALVVIVKGAGALSVDHVLHQHHREQSSNLQKTPWRSYEAFHER